MSNNNLNELTEENNRLREIIINIAEMLCDENISYTELLDALENIGIVKKQIKPVYEVNEEWGKA